MKIKKILPILLATSMLFTSCGKKEEVKEEEVLTAVKAMEITNSTIGKNITYSGKFEPIEQVSVVAKIGGTVTNTYKNVGDEVTAGETLYRVDDSDIRLAIDQANAQASAANVAIKQAQNSKNSITGAQYEQNILSLETSIKNLETQLNSAKDSLALAKNAFDNTNTLYSSGVVSKNDFDQAQNAYNQAQAQVTSLENQLSQTKQTYEITKNALVSESTNTAQIGIEQAQASAKSAQLAVQNASKNLEDVAPTSPISGLVSTKGVQDGQMVGTGSVAYTISNIDQVVATINVTENVINKLAVGDTLDVSVSTVDGTFKGTITEINPVATQTSTYPVKIKLDNKDHSIKPGMFCQVSILTDSSENTISLPRKTVLRNMDELYVYVIEDGVAKMKIVTTGIDNGKDIEILTGLNVGDVVITEGQTYVTDNEKVNLVK